MAKRRHEWNDRTYNKYLREGRGQGAGAGYKPWIIIHDFSSVGFASRVVGTKAGRIHHLMSNLELYLFYLLDWSDDILDIREQYPLADFVKAIEIAETAGIPYPYDPKSGFPYVMTSDFFIETKQGAKVLSVKPSSELSKPRVREKLEIERRYWREHGISWSIITEREINRTKARNIEWLAQSKDLRVFGIHEYLMSDCIRYFLELYCAGRSPLPAIIAEVENEFNFGAGIGVNIFKYLAYWKLIAFDAERTVDFSVFSAGMKLRYVGGTA